MKVFTVALLVLTGCSMTQPVSELDAMANARLAKVDGSSYCAARAVSLEDGRTLCEPGDCACHDRLTHETFWRQHEAVSKGKSLPQ